MLRQFITIAAFTLATTPLAALCNGPSYFDRLTPAEITQIDTYAATLPYGQGTYWTATRGSKTLTVVGTIHIYDARLTATMNTLTDSVTSADLILLEATPIEETQLQTAIQSDPTMIFISDGPTLPERLDDATWNSLMQAAKLRGVPAPLTAKLQPWYLTVLLAMPPCALDDTANGKRGLDHLIMQTATASDVPMQALEPFDTLIKVMRDGTQAEQLDMLKLSIIDDDTQIAMFTAMRDSYFSQNIGQLMGLSHIASRHIPNLDADTAAKLIRESEDTILTARNIAWMPVITQATQVHDNIFIGVGAAHLPGDQGLLKLLETDGWILTKR